ncbi:hypothetical protein QEZ48_00630 [Aquamicrobium lusatiense]|uniref:hypothetical protein n=1 Tax=Aquamicrobium lusatiense TaxID=89772 RepID=UPI0024563EB5|nr:hypothetical protein [Aquamicrobium lusatiense]MDH4989338.1 hypothetical protein [Aquamicrobium lusatiense]
MPATQVCHSTGSLKSSLHNGVRRIRHNHEFATVPTKVAVGHSLTFGGAAVDRPIGRAENGCLVRHHPLLLISDLANGGLVFLAVSEIEMGFVNAHLGKGHSFIENRQFGDDTIIDLLLVFVRLLISAES